MQLPMQMDLYNIKINGYSGDVLQNEISRKR